MSNTLQEIIHLVDEGQVHISSHGYDELAADNIFVRDIIYGLSAANWLQHIDQIPIAGLVTS